MRILIADDDAVSRRLLAVLATKAGYEVVAAEDGTTAWELLQRDDAPSLVTLDWVMPGIDGIDVCRRLRARERAAPTYVMMVTSRGATQDIVAALSAGADDFVSKPFDPAELNARLSVGRRMIELRLALDARIHELSEAIEHVKTLQGIIPICMHCHRIRSDAASWQKVEKYVEAHSEAHFTHALCPQCLEQHYPEDKPK